ncbi:MAG: acetoacetyl-CoA synthase [Geobacter sp.]|nr:acetoacetyl-CoA synthase [Geobacter sp.]
MRLDFYNQNAQKKPTNLSINSDLLKQAKEYHVNLSQTLELRLVEILRDQKQREWQVENQEALEEYNKRIEARGVFSDGLRQF